MSESLQEIADRTGVAQVEVVTKIPDATDLEERNVIYSISSECFKLAQLLMKKRHDYGDNYHASFEEEGFAMVRIRLTDKLNRLKTLTRKGVDPAIGDETIADTLADIAGYAILTLVEMNRKDGKNA